MPDGLYERDALAWAKRQAGLLRRLAAGEQLHEPVDWAHVIEEVADVGLAELRACQSLLEQAMVHLLTLHAAPDSQAAAHRRGEATVFLAGARRHFTPSMRQRIDLGALHADALDGVRAGADEAGEARGWPETCPFGLDELVGGRSDVAALVGRLGEG